MHKLVKFAVCYALVYFLLALPVHEFGHVATILLFGGNVEMRYVPPFGFAVSSDRLNDWQKIVCGLAGGFTAAPVLLLLRRFASDTSLNLAMLAHAVTNAIYAPFDSLFWYNSKPYYYMSAALGLLAAYIYSKYIMPRSNHKRVVEKMVKRESNVT